VLVLLGVSYWYVSGPGRPGGEAGSVIADLSGSGNTQSPTFFARENWQIEWQTEGQAFSFAIHGDVDFGTVVTQDGPGSGISSPTATGDFFIEVTAEGPWSITVTQGD
jgi:hypothetical protein